MHHPHYLIPFLLLSPFVPPWCTSRTKAQQNHRYINITYPAFSRSANKLLSTLLWGGAIFQNQSDMKKTPTRSFMFFSCQSSSMKWQVSLTLSFPENAKQAQKWPSWGAGSQVRVSHYVCCYIMLTLTSNLGEGERNEIRNDNVIIFVANWANQAA
jgi:hypothetical protein